MHVDEQMSQYVMIVLSTHPSIASLAMVCKELANV